MALSSINIFFVLLLCFTIPISCLERPKVALFVFGDSLFDPGNNNYINTTTEYQANWWPYGQSFFKNPTGRISDGRLIPDFIAEYANLPFVPSYFHFEHAQSFQGVNFASGGAGCLVETYTGFVINLKMQVRYFKKVRKELKKKLGAKESKKLLSNAVYIFSIGNNDYLYPFESNSSIFYSYTQQKYTEMVIGNLTTVLKGIYKKGGRKFGILNLAPLGCIPSVRAFSFLQGDRSGKCVEKITALSKMHNSLLQVKLKQLKRKLTGFHYTIFDLFNIANETINNPSKFGFKTATTACCGTGPFRGIDSCGGKRQVKEFQLCENVKDYLFFDSSHPTEKAYKQFAKLFWDGAPEVVRPYNLKSLFQLSVT